MSSQVTKLQIIYVVAFTAALLKGTGQNLLVSLLFPGLQKPGHDHRGLVPVHEGPQVIFSQ